MPRTPLRTALYIPLKPKGSSLPPASEHCVSYCHPDVWVESVPFEEVEERADAADSFGSGRGGVGGGAEAPTGAAG